MLKVGFACFACQVAPLEAVAFHDHGTQNLDFTKQRRSRHRLHQEANPRSRGERCREVRDSSLPSTNLWSLTTSAALLFWLMVTFSSNSRGGTFARSLEKVRGRVAAHPVARVSVRRRGL